MVDSLRLSRLAARGFRNLELLSFEPGPRFNVVHGDNGQGKSNLLEAIDYVATLRSFRGASAEDMIARGTQTADLLAEVYAEPIPHSARITLSTRAQRAVQLDGKRPRSRSAYVGTIPLVLFHPGDMQLVAGSPEQAVSNAANSVFIPPSSAFNATLPVKPSATTTSTASLNRSNPST